MGARPFATIFSLWGGGLFDHVGAFLLLFTLWWGPFLACPPPYKNFCAPMRSGGCSTGVLFNNCAVFEDILI